MLEDVFEVFTSTIFALGIYSKKYGTMLERRRSQYGKGRDQYPKSLQVVVDVMRLHKHDDRKLTKSGAKRKTDGDYGGEGENATSFAQRSSKKRLYACGSKEHVLTNCPHKDDIPRGQWYNRTNREFTYHQSEGNDSDYQKAMPIFQLSVAQVLLGQLGGELNFIPSYV